MAFYLCPNCNQSFEKAVKKACPHCKTPLISRRGHVNGGLKFWFSLKENDPVPEYILNTVKNPLFNKPVLPNREDITITPESPEKLSSKYPIRLTEPGQVPVVIQAGDNEFDVYFVHMMYSGMVYCPKCQSPAFQNMQLFGDLEHWCAERFDGKACKARTTYHFNDPVGVEVN